MGSQSRTEIYSLEFEPACCRLYLWRLERALGHGYIYWHIEENCCIHDFMITYKQVPIVFFDPSWAGGRPWLYLQPYGKFASNCACPTRYLRISPLVPVYPVVILNLHTRTQALFRMHNVHYSAWLYNHELHVSCRRYPKSNATEVFPLEIFE